MDQRQYKGLEIAFIGGVYEKKPGIWIVPSQTSSQKYTVKTTVKGPVCSCLDFELRRKTCKHIWAVTYVDIWANPNDFPNVDPITLIGISGMEGTQNINSKNGIDIKEEHEF